MTVTTLPERLSPASLDLDAAAPRLIADAPAFWTTRQAHARTVFEALPWPAERDEAWRYSSVERMKFAAVDLALRALPRHPHYKSMLRRDVVAGQIVFQNDQLVVDEYDADLRAAGVYFADLRTALAERPDLIERYFMTDAIAPEYGKFAALHGALVSQGAILYVPRGVVIDKPFEVLNTIHGEGVTIFPHLLMIAEANAQVSFINSYGTADEANSGTAIGAMELFVVDGARVNFVTMNNWSSRVRHVEAQRHIAGRDAEVKNLVMTLGSEYTRINVEAVIRGQGARSEMLGLYVANGRQEFDHRTMQDHQVGDSYSDVLYKGALLDRSHTIFSGLINVAKKAQKTDAYQTNRNMLLSKDARADTMPKLEIQANDVKCSHGATVGQIAFEHLFYLMSRGIPRLEAEKLIVFGFFDEVLARLPVPSIQDVIRDRIGEKVLGLDYEQIGATRRLAQGA